MKGYLSGMSPESYVVKPRSPIEAIYTVGGRNSHRCLPTGERYVAEDNRWEELPPMKQVRTAVAVGKPKILITTQKLQLSLKKTLKNFFSRGTGW